MLVVVAIIAMIMASTPTLYSQLVPQYQVRQYANDLANFARRARERALQDQIVTGFLYSPDAQILVSLDEELSIPNGVEIEFERDVVWSSIDENRVEFYPSGASSGGRFEVNRDTVSVEVSIDWISGSVEVVQ